jgi:hypothetical protein
MTGNDIEPVSKNYYELYLQSSQWEVFQKNEALLLLIKRAERRRDTSNPFHSSPWCSRNRM